MINWTSFFILTSKNEVFKINTDILETNVVNIILLLIILFFTAGSFIKTFLTNRYQTILTNIEESEKRLTEANARLAEARYQWSQAKIVFEEMKNETNNKKNILLETELNQVYKVFSNRSKNLLIMIRYRDTQTYENLIKQVSQLAVNKVIITLQKLGETELSLINDIKIYQLGQLGGKL